MFLWAAVSILGADTVRISAFRKYRCWKRCSPAALRRAIFPVSRAITETLNTVFRFLSIQQGDDLYDVIWLNPVQIRHGGPYAYDHREKGKKLIIKIPPGLEADSNYSSPGTYFFAERGRYENFTQPS